MTAPKPTVALVMLLLFAAPVTTVGAQTAIPIAVQVAELAEIGAAIAQRDPVVAAARTAEPDIFYWKGFSVATGIFGDPALGAQGHTAMGPNSQRIRDFLTAVEQRGFDAGVKFHLNRRYKRGPGDITATDRKNSEERFSVITDPNRADVGSTSDEVRCRGFQAVGMFTTESTKSSSTGETISTILLTSEPGPYAAGARGEGLRPGECAWVDKPIDVRNIDERWFLLRFETPANAQLKQVLHGTPVDASPTAAKRFPDAQTIPAYMSDPDHYWRFYGVRRVNNFYTATGSRYWEPERPGVKSIGRVKQAPRAMGPQLPICDVAAEAGARNSPSAPGLEENCRADLAARGAAIAQADSIVANARAIETDAVFRMGFDIASGIFGDPALGAQGHTATGPKSLKIRDSLNAAAQRGFDASVKLHLSRNYRP